MLLFQSMNKNLDTVEYASMLFDFYGSLLDASKAKVMRLYHEDNLSLSEIAIELGMTRQAVHYTLNKAEGKLEEYERKLELVKKYEEHERKASEALCIIDKIDVSLNEKERLREVIKELVD